MIPRKDCALAEIEIAKRLNPGPWIQHSRNVGLAAQLIAMEITGMDATKAYTLGLLHDIGRRVGIVGLYEHVYSGYKYCIEKGWDEVAKVCMTHSFVLKDEIVSANQETEEITEIRQYVENCRYDDYDLLIQLCDSLATDYGMVILEKRFVDVTRRYGIVESYIKGWDRLFEIKEYFEKKMNISSIYNVLPNVSENSLISLEPWKGII